MNILSFFILQYLCINSITISDHLFLINSLFQSTKYIHTTSDFPQNCLILLLKQELTVVNVTLDFNVQKYGILLMKSLNFSLLYNLRRKWNITLLRNINPHYLSVPIDLILDNIYCTFITLDHPVIPNFTWYNIFSSYYTTILLYNFCSV